MKAKSQKKQIELPDFNKMWDYNDPSGTEAKFRELIPIARESGDNSYYAQLLTQIARAEGLQLNFEDAHRTLDTVKEMLTDAMVVAQVRYLLERGRIYNSSKRQDKAKPLFLEAYKVATANKEDYYAIDAIHMLQIVEPPEKQLNWAEKAIEIAERTEDERAKKWLGPLYNNTGWTYFDLKQYDKALEFFTKGYEWRKNQKDLQGTLIAQWTIARTYREIGKVTEALEIQKEIIKSRAEEGLDPGGYAFEEAGECLLMLKKEKEAKLYFKKAYEILSQDKWLQTNEPARLERLKKLGE